MQKMMKNEDLFALERDSYIVLLHLYTFTHVAPVEGLTKDRIIRDLGLHETRADQILRDLLWEEYIEYGGTAEVVSLTAKGVRYIEREAGRRRSLRLMR